MSRLYPEDISDIIDIRNNWTDPNPPPIVEMHHGFHVVRDDLLEYGSKTRFIDYLVKTTECDEWVFGGANKVGWGPISLTYVCNLYNKKQRSLWLNEKNQLGINRKYWTLAALFIGLTMVCLL